MPNPTYTKLPIDIQKQIKAKYMEGFNPSQLASEYKLVRQSLEWYIKKHSWVEEKRLMRAELFQQFSDTKKAAFTGIYLDGTNLLRKAIQDAVVDYNKKSNKMTVKERLALAKQLSEVIKELDKIQRLDEGQPTEIKEERPFSIKHVKDQLNKDPFYIAETKDAEFEEVE
jgi:hypothetical protein